MSSKVQISLIVVGTLAGMAIAEAIFAESKRKQEEESRLLVEATTKQLTDGFIKSLEDKHNVRPELRLVK